jgi:cell division protein FtsZ
MFELLDSCGQSAVIKVIGVGGGGGNAVQHMVNANIDGVEFICANTDSQALQNMSARITLQIGSSITKGLGAGANPDVGRQAAQDDRDRIAEVIEGADMLFITAGMGAGGGPDCQGDGHTHGGGSDQAVYLRGQPPFARCA